MVSSHPSKITLEKPKSLANIRASQKQLCPVVDGLNYTEVVEHLSERRSVQQKWDLFFGNMPQELPITDPIRLADLSASISKPDALTEYVPSIRRSRPQDINTIPVPAGRRTKKHNLMDIALRIALTETVKLLLQEHLNEHDQLPFQIRMRDSLAKKFLKAGLIYQGHVIFCGVLIPLITDPSVGENIAGLVY